MERVCLVICLLVALLAFVAAPATLEIVVFEVTFSGPMPAGAGPWAVSVGTEVFLRLGPADHLLFGAATDFTAGTGGGSIGYQHDFSADDHVRLKVSADYAAGTRRLALTPGLALFRDFSPQAPLGLRVGASLAGSFAVQDGQISGFALFPGFLLSLRLSPEGSFAFFETARIGWPLVGPTGWLIPLSLTTSLAYTAP